MNRRALLTTFAATGAGVPAAALAAPREAPPGFIATRDGERLQYQDWGQGRPVVFVHGWAMSSAFWEYQTVLAGQGLRCIAYDQRGCGRSSPAATGYDLDTMADDLDAVMRALDLRDVVLVSHSMGSAHVARYLARHGPSRVAKVMMTACTTPCLLQGADNPHGLPAAVVEKSVQGILADRSAYVTELAGPFFSPAPVSPAMLAWGIDIALGATLRAAVEQNRTNLTADLRPDMAAFTMPTVLIHGDGDATSPLPLTAERTAKLIPAAKLVIYEGAGHGLPLTHATRLNRDILDFAGG